MNHTWEDTVTSAKELWELASEKTTQALEVQKLRIAIHKKKAELNKKYETLGRVYYTARSGQSDEEGLAALCEEIETSAEQLKKLQKLLEFAKNMRVCTACGKKNPAGSEYCNGCGKKFG